MDETMHTEHDHMETEEVAASDSLNAPIDTPLDVSGTPDSVGSRGDLSSSDLGFTSDSLDARQTEMSIGPVDVEARQVEGAGGLLPETVAFVLYQLSANVDTHALQGDLRAAAGGVASDSDSAAGITADATVNVLGRYDIRAHVAGADLDVMLDFMREGRPVLLGVERSEFWATVDDRGEESSREPVRLGEWRNDSDKVELFSATEPAVPLYEISKSSFLSRWREQDTSLVVVDEQAPSSTPAPVLLPIVLDAADGLTQLPSTQQA